VGEDASEPRLWIDIIQLRRLNERVHEGRSLRAAFRSGEQP
jgi:hypothetical protein